MKMTTLRFRHLLAAALCLLCIPANAQLSKTVEQYANDTWANVAAEFTLTEVAEALSTDTATLNAALDAWYDDETGEAESLFFLADPEDATVLSNNYTQGSPGGFWVGSDGRPAAWGAEGLQWFNYLYWNVEEDAFSIIFGQMPEVLAEGATFTPKFVLKHGDKQVSFDITYIVKPVPAIPDPTTIKISELNVVGTAVVNAHRTDIQGYDVTALTVDASEVISKLGLDQTLLGAQLSQLLYASWRDTELGVMKDSLTNASTASAPGWWMQRVFYPQGHENQGEASPDLGAAAYGAECHVFLESFAYDEETNAITCNLGQYPGTPVAGDSVSANIYVIYADKAYRLNYQVVFDEAPKQGFADMNNVGNTDFNLTFYDDFIDYQAVAVNVDVDDIAAQLGCEASAITFTGQKDEDGLWVGNYTSNTGYYFNEEGFVCAWGSGSAFYVEPPTEGDITTLNVGLFAGMQANVGETYSAKVYLVNGQNYYTLTFNCSVEHRDAADQSTWKVVEKRPAVVQVRPSSGYDGEVVSFKLTTDQIYSVIGTTDPMMYVLNHDSIAESTGEIYAPYTKYPCDPKPGVWLNKGGWGQLWAGSEEVPVGICWAASTGEFTVYTVPGVVATGTTFEAPIFFMNEEAEKLLEIDFTIRFVDEIIEAEIVGTEDIVVPVTFDSNIDIDLTKPAEALGMTVNELLNGYTMAGMKSNGLYSDDQDPINMGLAFGMDGYYDEYGVIYMMVIDNGGSYQLNVACDYEVAEDYRSTGAFCFEKDNKRYIYNVAFVSEAIYSGIESVIATENAKDGVIYDLSGRRVQNPGKGLYIINGKKYVVK